MSDKIFAYSTLTNDQLYQQYAPGVEGGLPEKTNAVLIKGGSNMSSGSFPHFITPLGVATPLTEEQLQILSGGQLDMKASDFLKTGDFDFKKHMRDGFITIRRDRVDPEVAVAADMAQADKSAPLTPESPEFNKPDEDALRVSDKKPNLVDRTLSRLGINR